MGFEEFGYAGHWRGFIAWLTARLRLLCLRESGCGREVRAYLGGLLHAIERRFSPAHLLHDDRALMRQATAHLAGELGLEAADRKRLRALARHVFDVRMYNHVSICPDLDWKEVATPPADATPRKRGFLHAPFSPGAASGGGLDYARMIARLSQEKDPQRLLRGFDP